MAAVSKTDISKNFQRKRFRLGAVPGVVKGAMFGSFNELRLAGVHQRVRAGIAGRQDEGVASVVLNGKYDDRDYGDTTQVCDQSMHAPPHRAFVRSLARGRPVRVVRGYGSASKFAPAYGCVFGLRSSVVVRAWARDASGDVAKEEAGPGGFVRCVFRLEKIPEPESASVAQAQAPGGAVADARVGTRNETGRYAPVRVGVLSDRLLTTSFVSACSASSEKSEEEEDDNDDEQEGGEDPLAPTVPDAYRRGTWWLVDELD
ncbi:hypothetical protein EIP86_006444 [Pleurotus ostreatoroseus]|nr:hypothetical protein EIP86_006444 [Pleurotus ostreatoroseus]